MIFAIQHHRPHGRHHRHRGHYHHCHRLVYCRYQHLTRRNHFLDYRISHHLAMLFTRSRINSRMSWLMTSIPVPIPISIPIPMIQYHPMPTVPTQRVHGLLKTETFYRRRHQPIRYSSVNPHASSLLRQAFGVTAPFSQEYRIGITKSSEFLHKNGWCLRPAYENIKGPQRFMKPCPKAVGGFVADMDMLEIVCEYDDDKIQELRNSDPQAYEHLTVLKAIMVVQQQNKEEDESRVDQQMQHSLEVRRNQRDDENYSPLESIVFEAGHRRNGFGTSYYHIYLPSIARRSSCWKKG